MQAECNNQKTMLAMYSSYAVGPVYHARLASGSFSKQHDGAFEGSGQSQAGGLESRRDGHGRLPPIPSTFELCHIPDHIHRYTFYANGSGLDTGRPWLKPLSGLSNLKLLNSINTDAVSLEALSSCLSPVRWNRHTRWNCHTGLC